MQIITVIFVVEFWNRLYALSRWKQNLALYFPVCCCKHCLCWICFQHLANSIGRILDLRCKEAWLRIQSAQPQALVDLMHAVEKYTSILARNMPQTFTQPFDAVHDNIGMSCHCELVSLQFQCIRSCNNFLLFRQSQKLWNGKWNRI